MVVGAQALEDTSTTQETLNPCRENKKASDVRGFFDVRWCCRAYYCLLVLDSCLS